MAQEPTPLDHALAAGRTLILACRVGHLLDTRLDAATHFMWALNALSLTDALIHEDVLNVFNTTRVLAEFVLAKNNPPQ